MRRPGPRPVQGSPGPVSAARGYGVIRRSGGPPAGSAATFRAGPDDEGARGLAGSPHADGTSPHRRVPSQGRAPPDAHPEDATRALLSLGGDGASAEVRHRHGEGAEPVGPRAVPMGSARVPASVGRGHACAAAGVAQAAAGR